MSLLVFAGCQTARQPAVPAPQRTPAQPSSLLPAPAVPLVERDEADEPIVFSTLGAAYEAADKLEEQASELAATDLPKARAWWRRSRAIANWVLRQKPDHFDAVYLLGAAFDHEGRAIGKTDLEALRELHTHALEYYERASKLQPGNPAPLNSCGLMWDHAARLTARQSLSAARRLWSLSQEKFIHALQLDPRFHAAANNLGNARGAMASAVLPESFDEGQHGWDEAIVAYRAALAIKPDKVNAATNWGQTLMDQADAYAARGDLPRASALWREAREKLKNACAMDATYVPAPASLGRSFLQEADYIAELDPHHARQLWAEARQHLTAALELDPSDVITASNYAATLEHENGSLWESNRDEAIALWDAAIRAAEQNLQKHPRGPIQMVLLANALRGKATIISAQDMTAALTLWQTADGHYALSWQMRPGAFAAKQWATSLARHAKALPPLERPATIKLCEEANEKYAWAAQWAPQDDTVFALWGDCLLARAETEPPLSLDAIPLLREAYAKYQRAEELKPGSAYALERHGCALFQEAVRTRDIDPRRTIEICHEGEEKLRRALLLSPRHATAQYNWAVTLDTEARCVRAPEPQRAALLQGRAVELLRSHLELRPADGAGWQQLANSLGSLASIRAATEPETARKLWDEADRAMQTAADKSPGITAVLADWSQLLAIRADAKIDEANVKTSLFNRALAFCQRAASLGPPTETLFRSWAWAELNRADLVWFTDKQLATIGWQNAAARAERAAELAPHSPAALSVWGLALMRLYASSIPPYDPVYIQRAETVLLSAPEAARGKVAYNLACTYALKRQAAPCLQWLERAREANELPAREKVFGDAYLAFITASPEFQAWSAKTFPP